MISTIIYDFHFKITEKFTLPDFICERLKIKKDNILEWEILKKSIDARKKHIIYLNFSVKLKIKDLNTEDLKKEEKILIVDEDIVEEKIIRKRKFSLNPVIVGFGPAGIFTALKLMEKGYKPVILERGKKISERTGDVLNLWEKGILNINSNVQFGEGGAGTFSDGKLTCRKNDKDIKEILKILINGGGPPEILYEHKGHIGTDRLRKIITFIRKSLEEKGIKFLFSTQLTGLILRDNKIQGVKFEKEGHETDALVLAIGHSSRDTYKMLLNSGVSLEPKAFAMGLRIEHEQSLINKNQYGKFAGHPHLGQADYVLKYSDGESGRSIYSFCMCPGGQVICASSEEKRLVLNGMSNYKRDRTKGNSAIVVTVGINDFYKSSPLDGIDFQRDYERKAFFLGGGNYKAPVEHTLSFIGIKTFNKIPQTSYLPSVTSAKLKDCLPDFLVSPLKNGILNFCKKIKGFENSVLLGLESRTSSPVRILRDSESRASVNIKGLYPIGEGAGYAGGIISSALDGFKTAEVF